MLLWLKALNPRVWFGIAIVAAVVAYTGFVFHLGGNAPRAELERLVTQINVARDRQVARDVQRELDHKQLLKDKDNEREQSIAAVADSWKSYIAGLPKPRGGATANAQPIRITAEGLNNEADRARVSAAVSEFRDEVREAFRDFRDEVAGQLAECQANTDALTRAQVWAAEEQKLNQGP